METRQRKKEISMSRPFTMYSCESYTIKERDSVKRFKNYSFRYEFTIGP